MHLVAENQVKLADITEKLKNAESTTTVPDDVNIIDEDSQEMTLYNIHFNNESLHMKLC